MIILIVTILSALAITRSIILKQKVFKETSLWLTFILKIIAGILVGLIYTFYYDGGDTFSFHQDAYNIKFYVASYPSKMLEVYFDTSSIQVLDQNLNYNSSQPRALLFSKILSILYFLTNSNYWITTALVACFGFWSVMAVLLELQKAQKAFVFPVFIAFLAYPSTLFWTSGLLKESVMMITILGLVYSFLKIYRTQRVSLLEIFIFSISILLLWALKYYILGLLITFLFPACIVSQLQKFGILGNRYTKISWVILTILFLVGGTFLHPNLSFYSFLGVLIKNHDLTLALTENTDGTIIYNNLQPTITSLIVNAPKALTSGLFRPFIWEAYSITALLASIENLILVILTFISVLSIKWIHIKNTQLITLSILIYILASSILLSISTPNLGSLSRYKVAFIPFLVVLILNSPWIKGKMGRFEYLLLNKTQKSN